MTENQVEAVQEQEAEQAPAVQQEPEKMLTQSEVNKLVGKIREETKERTYRKARQEIMAELQQQVTPDQQQADNSIARQAAQATMGGMSNLNPEQIRQLIAEETAKQTQAIREHQEQEMHRQNMSRIASNFIQKMEAGKEKHPEFESKVAMLNLPSIPEIVHLAEGVENTADVMMDLAENPHKISNLLTLYARNPALAQAGMNKISESIKQNDIAKNMSMPSDPYQSIKPSASAKTGDGNLSVSDLQKYFSKKR
jgi:hypothetical protein